MKNEPIALAKIFHERLNLVVQVFGKRIDALTARIGKAHTIVSPQDAYVTLAFPDLPEGDQISDELVAFMESAFPTKEIAFSTELRKKSIEAGLAMDDPEIRQLVIRTLHKDVAASEQALPQLQLAAQSMKTFPAPPLKKRSIHFWIERHLQAVADAQSDLQQWRKATLSGMHSARCGGE